MTDTNSRWAFSAIGTEWLIQLGNPVSDHEFTTIKTSVARLIDGFDRTYSRFRGDSLVSQLRQKPGRYVFPDSVTKMMTLYRQLYDLTDHRMTPVIGQLLEDTGYDADYSLQPKTLRTVPDWNDVLSWRGNLLTTSRPVTLDFGAAGKGYLAELIADLLRSNGQAGFYIDASGDIITDELADPLTVGLENPFVTDEVIGTFQLATGALCGSAVNRRRWRQFHHIMDPLDRTPISKVAASWVWADSGLIADGLATALFFTSPDRLAKDYEFEYLVVGSDGSASYSQAFSSGLY